MLFKTVFILLSQIKRPALQHYRSRWPQGLRRGSAAARLLGLRVRIPPGTPVSVSCQCVMLSGKGLCEGLIPRPEEFYRVHLYMCVCLCVCLSVGDLENPNNEAV